METVWLAVVGILFQLFDYWQGRGLRKAGLLVVIGALCWALYRWTGTKRIAMRRPPAVTWILLAAALLLLGNSIVRGVGSFAWSRRQGDVLHDQGQIAHRTLRLLGQGVNPYGSHTMLDPLAFADQVDALARRPECGSVDPDAATRAFAEYWDGHVDAGRMLTLPPVVADSPTCHGLHVKFQSLGYHYGPVLLAAYLPLVALFGPAGIYAVHLLALLIWIAVLGVWLKQTLVSVAWVPALSAMIVFLLAPTHINDIFLQLAASDLIPTILASVGLLCWLQGRDVAAAVLVALSVGSKLFPGVLFAPLLLRNRKAVVVCVVVTVALYLPFAVWEPAGLIHNLLYPFTIRDTTSPLAAISPAAGTLLRIGAVGSIGAWIWRLAIQRWPGRESLLFLVSLHLAALVLGGMSHNNYLIWAMAAIAVFWIWMVDRSGEPAAEGATRV
jgi:hypothetical protein